jgi:hypothetical protein
MSFVRFSLLTAIISLNSVTQSTFVMAKSGVPFEVRIILKYSYTSFGFKVSYNYV